MSHKLPEERYWAKVNVGSLDDCWPWGGSVNSAGYGQFYFDGALVLAHRFAYLIANAGWLISSHERVRHSCHNRLCQNLTHLYLVSRKI